MGECGPGGGQLRRYGKLKRLRWIDTTELERYRRERWLEREELDLIERFVSFLEQRLSPIPDDVDAVGFTQADPGWQVVRERARELVVALNAFVDLGVPGWGHQYGSIKSP